MSDHESHLVGFISKVVPSFLKGSQASRDLNMLPVPEEESVDVPEDLPESLEGTLFYRKGRSAMNQWKRRYVVLNLNDGSISCYRFTGTKHYHTRVIRKVYSKLQRRDSIGKEKKSGQTLCLNITSDVPWIVRDIANDTAAFVVEVPHSHANLVTLAGGHQHDDNVDGDDYSEALSFASPMNYSLADDHMSIDSSWINEGEMRDAAQSHGSGRGKRSKPLRMYFHCPRRSNEKALWLRAFSAIDRLSSESTKKRKLFGSLKHMARVSRIRSPISADLARESLQLDNDYRRHAPPYMISTRHLSSHTEVEELTQASNNGDKAKEYRVQPSYAYPHRWMTHQELRDEMVLPSSQFHNLRMPSGSVNEIGSLNVEVLQCLGLPKLDKAAETNAVVYCVCGSYAFATDSIPSCSNPMWLCKMRRAASIPIFHAYAKMYVGVFDEDGKKEKDDFIGRIALDLTKLRPGCTYDVTLPLRLSSHVYSRRQRGAIRLRFHLEWTSERKALLSYLPKRIKLPRRNRPSDPVTVLCSGPKAFRNVAITVHGAHLPGRFSTNQLRAAIKEFNFTRIKVMRMLRETIRNTVFWKNPAISSFVFLSWMHCIYANAFSLVPAYTLSFLLLHLMKNYARYNVEMPAQIGFLPPTWEEMFCALVGLSTDEASRSITPLDMYMKRSSFMIPLSELDDSQDNLVVQTHKPSGMRMFSMLGFLEGDDCFDSIAVDDSHLEFPFSSGVDYPRFSIRDSLDTREHPKRTRERLEDRGSSRDNSATNSDARERDDISEIESRKDGTDLRSDDDLEVLPDAASTLERESDRSTYSLTEYRSCAGPPVHEIRAPGVTGIGERPDDSQPARPMPEQNIDVRVQAREDEKKVTLTEELQDIKEKIHELTFHVFNNKSFVVKDDSAWGKSRRSKKGNSDAKRDLEKILNVGQYSHSNPVIGRIGLYIEPIVSASMSFLCLFRSLFNIYTWQDPFLSFWISFGSAITIAVLFVFPWRLFMFLLGIVSVGPQNWFLRIYRERRRRNETDKIPSASSKSASEVDQFVFDGHTPANQALEDRRVAPSCTHHVVVPYSPLMYQRFYDWPPEPQYSRVKADASASSQLRQTNSVVARSKSSPPSQGPVITFSPARSHHKRSRSNPVGMSLAAVSSADRSEDDSFADSLSRNSPHDITTSPAVQRSWLQGHENKKRR